MLGIESGVGDWGLGLGIGDWGWGLGPTPVVGHMHEVLQDGAMHKSVGGTREIGEAGLDDVIPVHAAPQRGRVHDMAFGLQ